MRHSLLDILLIFPSYAMFGWIIESFFKTVFARKFVNSGFLTGPFCPIYGFGALLVIQASSIAYRLSPRADELTQALIGVFLAILLTTLLEYLTGTIMEALFNSKWWDYSQEKLNIHGRVCLKYSLYWGILSYVLLSVVHPYASYYIYHLPIDIKSLLACMLIVYFAIDLTRSTSDAYDLHSYLGVYINQNYREELLKKHSRLLEAFPQLRLTIMKRHYREVKDSINKKWKKLRRIDDFRMCINDLITHESIQEMKLYRHHSSVSCFEHSVNVSYASFMLCRAIGWDCAAAARGGLLHDLFLYDWRTHKPQEGLHGFVHPRLALNNASEVCTLNEVERDIILKHMFPLTWPPPRYKESMLVCLVDSLCSLWEVLYSVRPGKSFSHPTTAIINDI